MEKRANLDKLKEVLKKEHVTIDRLNKKTPELLQQAKVAHATADAYISACVELGEDLNRRAKAISQQELEVAKPKQELLGKEEEITGTFECECSELKSHINDLSACEATLKMERGHLRKTREDLCNHEVTIS
jgi:hypothetical protein